MSLIKKHYQKFLIILTCFTIISTQTGCVRDRYGENNSLEEGTRLEKVDILLVIRETQDKIMQNIKYGNDIDFGLDFGRIEYTMLSYRPSPGSFIVIIDGKAYDLLILNELQIAYDNIVNFWLEHRSAKIPRLVATSINQMSNGEFDDYTLANAIFYFSWQSEMSASFFPYLFELFQLRGGQYNSYGIRGLSIAIPPLPITVIYIDEIPYDSIAIIALQSNIETRLSYLENALTNNLTREINRQFDIMVSNVDSYLDWYYSLGTDLSRMWRGGLDSAEGLLRRLPFVPDQTDIGRDQEFMLINYLEIMGRGTTPGGVIDILENKRDSKLELVLIFVSLLEDSSLDFYYYTEVVDTIIGDQIMAPFIQTADRLDILVFEGMPLFLGMGDGNILDANTLALDLVVGAVTTAIGFIPFVGVPLSFGLDFAWLLGGSAAREGLTREDLRIQIIYAIENSRRSVISMLYSDLEDMTTEIPENTYVLWTSMWD